MGEEEEEKKEEPQKEIRISINKAVHEDLNPLEVLDLFRKISGDVRQQLN